MSNHTYLAKRIQESLDVISILAEVLICNGGHKDNENDDNGAQIDARGKEGIHQAIRLIALASHKEFCQLATELEIPE
ncbi:hypothetical protein [Pseudomonas coleopterorum]|uniref:Uncharacterized protein n=1 Tax=Pseudomonas coleopterorum TaxID=1605838 RepID=A0AAJ6LYV4_9PSED|nr:hypothetical protein [Pseudomonas coleopterorum]WNC09315.1 hypothetical protein RI108_18920 [Pseudomonas coleopterorum]